MGTVISVVIPVYRNAENIPSLLQALEELSRSLRGEVEVVFVADGSPDDAPQQLALALPSQAYRAQLLTLSRNFGSFAAIRAGMAAARGDYVAVMAADLQEPPELIVRFKEELDTGHYDVAVGARVARHDPPLSKFLSAAFWNSSRRFLHPDLPRGGVDVFACTQAVRDQLVRLPESNSSLVGLLFWVGFRRTLVPYERRARKSGRSAWTFAKKWRYLSDSVFGFTDLPILFLTRAGVLGMTLSVAFACVVVVGKTVGAIQVPGYTATALIVTFFGALNCFGLGLIGGYVWRAFENSKLRPNFIVASHEVHDPIGSKEEGDDDRQVLPASKSTGRDR